MKLLLSISLLLSSVAAMAAEYKCPVPANAGLKMIYLSVYSDEKAGELIYEFNSGLKSRPHRCIGDSVGDGQEKWAKSFLCIGPSILADNSLASILMVPESKGRPEAVSIRFLAKGDTEIRDFSPEGPSETCEKAD